MQQKVEYMHATQVTQYTKALRYMNSSVDYVRTFYIRAAVVNGVYECLHAPLGTIGWRMRQCSLHTGSALDN